MFAFCSVLGFEKVHNVYLLPQDLSILKPSVAVFYITIVYADCIRLLQIQLQNIFTHEKSMNIQAPRIINQLLKLQMLTSKHA